MSAPQPAATFSEEVEIAGHIIDSLLLPKILDEIAALGGRFEIGEVRVGHRRVDPSYARLRVEAGDEAQLERILTEIGQHGAVPLRQGDCHLVAADMAAAFPEGFYATTNQETEVRVGGHWLT